jgi:hypothetical protein
MMTALSPAFAGHFDVGISGAMWDISGYIHVHEFCLESMSCPAGKRYTLSKALESVELFRFSSTCRLGLHVAQGVPRQNTAEALRHVGHEAVNPLIVLPACVSSPRP